MTAGLGPDIVREWPRPVPGMLLTRATVGIISGLFVHFSGTPEQEIV